MGEPSSSPSRAWTLPIIPRSFNSLNWGHWRKKKDEADRWKKAVLAIPRGPFSPPPPVPTCKVRITITVYRKQVQDPDNATASCKYLVDALVKRGWAKDDSREYLDAPVREEVDRRNQRTEIRWERDDP